MTTTSSSSIPVLGPVLYFTSTDGYSFDVDNRPLFHLDTNIRHINTSLVGIGYGEHASNGGGLLTPGKAVTLFSNGSVFYPTDAPSTNSIENIVGLVIGATDTGLNRVIWSSKHLDLDVLGLSYISSGYASGSYLVCNPTTDPGLAGAITVTTTPNLVTQYVVGRIKSGPYVEINTASELVSNDIAITVSSAVKDNHANLYGLSRLRNLLLFLDAGEPPVQYSKRTYRVKDYSDANGGIKNPMSAMLDSNKTNILTAGTDTTFYGTGLDSLVLKEQYTKFSNTDITYPEQVSCGTDISTWSPLVYGTTIPGNSSENYELQPFNSGTDYNANVGLFKNFTMDKYYQYTRVASGDPRYGKVQITATIFNPLYDVNPNQGGEANPFIVFDFYEYNPTSGLETYKHRVVLNGASAVTALQSSTGLFPSTLVNA
jgi:hypothetical protein